MALTVKDFKDSSGNWAKGYRVSGVAYITKSCQLWNHMRARCKVGGLFQARKPSYLGCTISTEFEDFQYFAGWRNQQVGCNTEGFQLDKDLLVRGNKVYGPNTCLLVPQELNVFLTVRYSKPDYPIGVGFSGGKFFAQINTKGIRYHLGRFDLVEDAESAYRVAKELEAKKWVYRLTNGEFQVSQKVVEAMTDWKVQISK